LLVDALTAPRVHALGHVTLGVGIVESESELFGQPVLVGQVEEDHQNPDGVWLTYVPV